MLALLELIEPVVTEPVPVSEVFASGILVPEDMGEVIRVTVYVERTLPGCEVIEHVIVGRFVFTKEGFGTALKVAAKFFAMRLTAKLKVFN